MELRTLEDLQGLDGARVLLRLDLNVPLEQGRVGDRARIESAVPTLRWLLEQRAVVAVCSHLGRPGGAAAEHLSLAAVAPALAEELGTPVQFVAACTGEQVESAVRRCETGTVLLLENLRFHPGEKSNDAAFARALAAPFSHLVFDAFGAAHRAHASTAAVAACFEPARRAVGRLVQLEVDALNCLMERPDRPFAAVIGGAKVSSKIAPLEALLTRVTALGVGGGVANTFLAARGLGMGRSLVEEGMLDTARDLIATAEQRGVELMLPSDLVVADSASEPSTVDTVAADRVPDHLVVVDIGPETVGRFQDALRHAATAFWNGPVGVFESERFAAGTDAVARALASGPGYTVAGGGESVMALRRAGVATDVSHVSTGGGAALEYIATGELPALTAIEG